MPTVTQQICTMSIGYREFGITLLSTPATQQKICPRDKNMKMQIAKVTLIFGVGTFLGRLYYFSWILIKPGMKSLFYRTIYFDLSTDFRFDDLYTKSIILFWSMNSIRYIFKHRVIVQQRLFMQVLDRFKLFWKIMFYTWLLDFH